jgi:predicted component of type VI protein secretion system
MNDQQYRLLVNKGPEPEKVYRLTSVSMTIGRDPMAEITINDPEVSRRHARLIGTLSGYRIQDLGSTNGTFVDGTRLGGEPLDLKIGQIISIGGGVVLVYQGMVGDDEQSVTILDVAMEPPTALELEEQPDIAGIEPDVEESGVSTNVESKYDEIDSIGIDAVTEEELDQPPSVEPLAPATNWESPPQEETPTPYQDGPDSYEAEDFPDPVVIPHQGEPAKHFSANRSSNSRRLSTVVAALLLLVICCCCSFILFLYYYGGDWLLRQMGLLP